MKVSQFHSKNQFIIDTEHGTYFQSYKSLIAFIPRDDSPIVLDERYWDYSVTTSKYLNRFLRVTGGKKEVLSGIKSGKYILGNLNS